MIGSFGGTSGMEMLNKTSNNNLHNPSHSPQPIIPKDFGNSMFSLKNITEFTKQNQNSVTGNQFLLG
jgi:hypothetical protein